MRASHTTRAPNLSEPRLRTVHPVASDEGGCRLLYDLERTAVVTVPEAWRGGLPADLESRRFDPEVEAWLWREGLLTRDALEDSLPRPLPQPARVTDFSLDLAGSCNLGCGYCFENDIRSRLGAMTRSTAAAALDFAFERAAGAARVTFHFGSGEPLLRFDLLREIVEEANRRGSESGQEVRYELTTNGTLVTREIADFLAGQPFEVQVSSDGPRRLHDENRPFHDGRSSYDEVMAGLEILCRALPERLTLNTVLTTGTRLAEIWSWAKTLGVGQLNVIKVGSYDSRELVRLGDGGLSEFRRDLETIAAELVATVTRNERPLIYTPLTRHVLRLMKGTPRTRYCGVAGSYLGVASDGRVYPCFRHTGLEDCELGSVAGGLDEDRRSRFRSDLARDVDHRPVCKDCWARYLCGGGCYADSTVYGSDPVAPQIQHCPYWRCEIEVALRLYHDLRESDPRLLLGLFGRDPAAVLAGMGLG